MTDRHRRESGLLVALWLLSLALNVTYCFVFEDQLVLGSDAEGYDQRGLKLARGQGFATSGGPPPRREPGILVFFGGVYSLFGHSHRAARLAQAVLASTFCLWVYAIGRQYRDVGYVPAAVPLVAAGLTVAYPAYVFYTGLLMREILATFLFLVSLTWLTKYVLTGRLKAAALYGLFAGLGGLVDGRFFYFSVFVGLAFLIASREWRRATFLGVAVGSALLVIAPWTIRNYLLFDQFVLLATAHHKALFLVTGPQELLEWDWDREPLRSLSHLSGEERDRELARLAIENLRQDPWPYLTSAPRRFFRLWIGGHSNVTPFAQRGIAAAAAAGEWRYVLFKGSLVLWSLFYVLGGAVGAVLMVLRYRLTPVLHMVAFLVYLSLVHMALFATPRYHIPAVPVLTIFLAYLVTEIATRWPVFRRSASSF